MLLAQAQEALDAENGFGFCAPKWVVIFDLEGFSFQHMRYPKALACAQEMSAIDSSYYPEQLGRFFIVNAPRIFNTIWQGAKTVVKAKTLEKISVSPRGDFQALVNECGAHFLPMSYGGMLADKQAAPCIF